MLLLLLVASLAYTLSCIGRFWLTSERLVWEPFVGEPVQISLRSIPEDGIRSSFFSIRVVGERTLHLLHSKQERDLAAVLELRRQPPLLGSTTTERLADVVCYEATLQGKASYDKGYVVLRPGFVAFLPKYKGAEALRVITGARPSPRVKPIEIPPLIEHLRSLPSEAAFDECVERVVAAAGGMRWSAWEVRHDARAPVWKEIRLHTDGSRPLVLSGKVDWSQQAPAERILADWPKR
ncbi:hypothetical protein [Archangium sp.]|uniref:hypothetical protein n=1 Tax=Archangium sp. TaxID=1872627 RepID=UPI002D24C408|nr:hypothetical protein [Archangium sp.]HYO55693.1 hypothetical protein [Archangium sp.]